MRTLNTRRNGRRDHKRTFAPKCSLRREIARLGKSSITTEIDVVRAEELLVAGRLRHVCVATDTWRKTDIPDWIRDGLRRFAGTDGQ